LYCLHAHNVWFTTGSRTAERRKTGKLFLSSSGNPGIKDLSRKTLQGMLAVTSLCIVVDQGGIDYEWKSRYAQK